MARSQDNPFSKMYCSMRCDCSSNARPAFVVVMPRFLDDAEFDVSVLFSTLFSLDFACLGVYRG